MAATVNKSFLFDAIKLNAFDSYEVFADRQKVAGNRNIEPDHVAELLNEIFESVEDSILTVRLFIAEKKKPGRVAFGDVSDVTYKVRLKNASGTAAASGLDLGTIERLNAKILELEKALISKQFELERLRLEDRLKALEEDKNNPVLEMAIKSLAGLLTNQSPSVGVAGVGDPPLKEASELNAVEVTRAALKRLAAVDSDLPDTLTLLAEFAEKKPADYKSFIPILKSMVG